MNRAQRRSKPKKTGKRDMRRQLADARFVQTAAIELEAERRVTRHLWITCLACHEVFGMGAGRVMTYLEKVNEPCQEWDKLRADADDEYADEKLRYAIETVFHTDVPFLFAHEAKEAKS